MEKILQCSVLDLTVQLCLAMAVHNLLTLVYNQLLYYFNQRNIAHKTLYMDITYDNLHFIIWNNSD